MSTLTTAKNVKTMNDRRYEEMREKLNAVRGRILDLIPTAVTLGLIALYYIQLSHMG